MVANLVIDQSNTYWQEGRHIKARLHSLWLGPAELLEGLVLTVAAAISAPVAIIKLPISLASFIFPGGNLSLWHQEMPGLTQVIECALRAALAFFNVIWGPVFGMLSPLESIKYHKKFGSIPIIPEPIPSAAPIPRPEFSLSFKDIVGMEPLKEKLQKQVINMISGDPERRKRYRISFPKGILFYGAPGCGKTHIAECLAGELKARLIKMKSSDVASQYIHEPSLKLKEYFRQAKQLASPGKPVVLFLDEFDGLATARNAGTNSETKAHRNEEITTLLQEIEEASKNNILVIAATNHISNLDRAIIRDGRFNTKIEITLPDEASRAALFQHYCKNSGLEEALIATDIDYGELGTKTDGWNCADVAAAVENAKNEAFSERGIISHDLLISIVGDKNRDRKLQAAQKSRTGP